MEKKNLIAIIIVTIIIVAAIGYNVCIKYQERISVCKDICNYSPGGKTWSYQQVQTGGGFMTTKYFQSQEQCVDYCLNK